MVGVQVRGYDGAPVGDQVVVCHCERAITRLGHPTCARAVVSPRGRGTAGVDRSAGPTP
jgi:hypothetical protein